MTAAAAHGVNSPGAQLSVAETPQEVIESLSAALGRPVLLDDDTLAPLAYTPQLGDIDSVRSQSILARGPSNEVRNALLSQGIAEAVDAVRTHADTTLAMEERLCVPVRNRGKTLAYIWLIDPQRTLGEREVHLARDTAGRLARMLADRARNENWDGTQTLAAIRSADDGEREAAIDELRQLGATLSSRVVFCLLAADAAHRDPTDVVHRVARRLSFGSAIAGSTPEGAGLLVAVTDPRVYEIGGDELASWMHSLGHAEVAVGQSGVTTLGEVHEAARHATIALRIACRRPAGMRFAAWSTLGADRLLAQIPDRARADIPDSLARLLRREPHLAATLAAYLDSGGDVKAVSVQLSLHRSGVYYRLRRIEELTGLRLSDGEDRLIAHVAIRIEQLS